MHKRDKIWYSIIVIHGQCTNLGKADHFLALLTLSKMDLCHCFVLEGKELW